MSGFRFFDPTAAAATEPLAASAAYSTLAGRRVALFDNSKAQADVALERIGELLRERYQVAALVPAKKPNYSAPAEDSLLDRIAAEADAVVFAIAA